MPKFITRIEKQNKLIDETFNDLDRVGKFKKIQLKIFKAVYKKKMEGLFFIMKRKLLKYRSTEGSDFFEAEEEGDDKFVQQAKKDFEKFIYGDEKLLNTEKEYQKFKNDRIVTKIMRNLKGVVVRSKDKAIEKSLGEGRVLDFFMKCGIMITWKVED